MKKLALMLVAVLISLHANSADVSALNSKGERLEGPLSLAGNGSWRIGPTTYAAKDLVVIRFAPDAPPPRVNSGIFLRGGSLLTGSLVSMIGDNAEISSAAFGALKLKREDIAGVFVPQPSGQPENMPLLSHYSGVLAAALGSNGSALTPGKLCRVRFAGLDEMTAEKVMRVGTDQILLSTKGKSIETVNRQFVRILELNVPPLVPSPDDDKLGPAVIIRLKGGDLLSGRVAKLSDNALTLKTTYLGERDIPRPLLAALFVAGGALNHPSGVTWLSSIPPEKSTHTPIFDSEFPAAWTPQWMAATLKFRIRPSNAASGFILNLNSFTRLMGRRVASYQSSE